MVSHGLEQVGCKSQTCFRVDSHGAPFHTTVGTQHHLGAFFGGQCPHAVLGNHGFREADECAGVAVMHIDVASFASMDGHFGHLAVFAFGFGQDGR